MEIEDFYQYNLGNNMKSTNWHNLKMVALTLLTIIVAGITAVKGTTQFDSFLAIILPILIGIEHLLNGNTTTTS